MTASGVASVVLCAALAAAGIVAFVLLAIGRGQPPAPPTPPSAPADGPAGPMPPA